jgi:nitrate/TMAO reductase-like tetraheme cytochrome c subunit
MKTAKRWAMFMAAGAVLSASAMADSHFSSAKNATWQAECGSCHVTYPPSMLPAESWRAVMSGLDKHFGTDASVDAKTAAEIGAFLEKNAGRSRWTAAKPTLRVTETRWFQHEHDEVSAVVWKSPKVKTPSNCAACHSGAEQGNFDDDDVRIPR